MLAKAKYIFLSFLFRNFNFINWRKFNWEYFKFNIEEMFESKDGSKVIVIGSYIGKYKLTGKQMEAKAAHLYEIRNQKIKTFRKFADTAVIVAAAKS